MTWLAHNWSDLLAAALVAVAGWATGMLLGTPDWEPAQVSAISIGADG